MVWIVGMTLAKTFSQDIGQGFLELHHPEAGFQWQQHRVRKAGGPTQDWPHLSSVFTFAIPSPQDAVPRVGY